MMKAISIRQPWAWLIIRPDIVDPAERLLMEGWFKDVENRTWSTNYRGILAIHTSKKPAPNIKQIRRSFAEEAGIHIPHDLAYGQIIGTVDLVDCVHDSTSEWFEGPIGWVLQDPQPIEPISYKGKLGLWNAPFLTNTL